MALLLHHGAAALSLQQQLAVGRCGVQRGITLQHLREAPSGWAQQCTKSPLRQSGGRCGVQRGDTILRLLHRVRCVADIETWVRLLHAASGTCRVGEAAATAAATVVTTANNAPALPALGIHQSGEFHALLLSQAPDSWDYGANTLLWERLP